MHRCRTALLLALLAGLAAGPAAAEVRFGPGVRIGGHDFSNRRYRSVHIARVKRLPGPPGCRHVRNGFYRRGDGTVVRGPMERCNLVAIPSARRR
ncbi:hypothetical protein [Methylobacterium dankookense]|uniref:Beta/gamma crystallin 'Greek key' domain-containing protein n=1 Tax=Methylobacterium dankookense TaxID=560405 RepID=A0A564FY31_9HYPH|nr:hypothetical protein [Methylobacterium dankookense]GJD54253.1 hypothetical protein IFDJLNFL_0121 [Methylobacterium dankookense]VUF12902.1 hypothetical protein MTDSW087_02597 [Methylobacterium dankookense]